jgi:hypothetical protein
VEGGKGVSIKIYIGSFKKGFRAGARSVILGLDASVPSMIDRFGIAVVHVVNTIMQFRIEKSPLDRKATPPFSCRTFFGIFSQAWNGRRGFR